MNKGQIILCSSLLFALQFCSGQESTNCKILDSFLRDKKIAQLLGKDFFSKDTIRLQVYITSRIVLRFAYISSTFVFLFSIGSGKMSLNSATNVKAESCLLALKT
jgi:hypothetical protein